MIHRREEIYPNATYNHYTIISLSFVYTTQLPICLQTVFYVLQTSEKQIFCKLLIELFMCDISEYRSSFFPLVQIGNCPVIHRINIRVTMLT